MPCFLRRTLPFLGIAGLLVFLAGNHPWTASLTRVSPYLTRAEAAAVLLTETGLLESGPNTPAPPASIPYRDVLPSDWFAASLLRAAELGIILPDSTGTLLRPFGSVNRASFLKMVALSYGLPAHLPSAFTDVARTSWYASYAGIEQTYQLFTHAEPNMLEPERLVTQVEAERAIEILRRARTQSDEENARETAIAQATGHVQIYAVISTKRLRFVTLTEPAPPPPSSRPPYRPPTLTPAPLPRKTTNEVRLEVLTLVNTTRKEAGLPPLIRNAALEESAQAYADLMHTEGFFGHTDPAGKTLKDRIEAVHYATESIAPDCQCVKGYALGENLARGQRSAEEVVRAWLQSPSHREAILGPDFTDIGIGVQAGIWVEHFGGVLAPEKP